MNLNPTTAIALVVGFIVAIAVHEFSHAFAARLLGDRTAEQAGRLTLNPIRHLDPFGTLLLVMTTLTGAPGIGWGKPVPVNGRNLRYGRTGMAIVSAAGPVSNIAMALLMALLVRVLEMGTFDVPALAGRIILTVMVLNVGLAVFNLIPVPPLDGFGVAVGVLPRPIALPLSRLAQYGPGILLILVFSSSLIRFDVLGAILGPPRQLLLGLVLRAAGLT